MEVGHPVKISSVTSSCKKQICTALQRVTTCLWLLFQISSLVVNMTEDFSLKALVLGTITMNANAETESC